LKILAKAQKIKVRVNSDEIEFSEALTKVPFFVEINLFLIEVTVFGKK